MRTHRWIWNIVLLMVIIAVAPQCTRKIVAKDEAVPTAEERQAAAREREQRTFEESLTAKKYAGIEGTVLESAMLKDVHFDFDRYDLTAEARAILAENAKLMVAHPSLRIQIEGHCDERGSNEYNLALGEKRAMSVKLYLVKLGVRADNLSTISYGEEMPLDPRHNEEAWAKNRRAHLVILST